MNGNSAPGVDPRSRRLTSWLLLSSLLAIAALSWPASGFSPAQSLNPAISKAAADSCDAKVQRMENYGAVSRPSKGGLTTRLSESELNSYLAIDLSPNYHPSLKSIQLKFEEGHLRGLANVDFDRLDLHSTRLVNSLLRKLLTGVHTLTVGGTLIADGGKANFNLTEAQFDNMTLPLLLVSEIISAVGRKQNPPFDPMEPSTLPYRIRKVDVHAGYVVIYQ